MLQPPERSFFLFGPRGTGKSSWVRERLPDAVYLDLLDSDVALDLAAAPARLAQRVPADHRGWIVLDEIQKVPELLDEVHRLIETRRLRFALTGSSARKLRRKGVNLLAGRALTLAMHPLTCAELGQRFDLARSLELGHLPVAQTEPDRELAKAYLRSYVHTYLREEVLQEGLTRNAGAFARFLEAASFSQGQPLNMSAVARDAHVERKSVEAYFGILHDLLLAVTVPVFTRRAKREAAAHPKFYFFDVGVWRAVRPRGPLDSDAELAGAAVETLVFQELRALNDYQALGYGIHTWRTRSGLEVDFVLYGERGLKAIEVKSGQRVRREDLNGLNAFLDDYPGSAAWLVYGGRRAYFEGRIQVVPIATFLHDLPALL